MRTQCTTLVCNRLAWTASFVLAALGSAAPAEAQTSTPTPQLPFPSAPILTPYAKQVLALGPAGYWRLGEKKGPTAFDWSKEHKHNGVYHGAPTFQQFGAIKNDPDRAVLLDGKSYVQVPASDAL